MNRPRGTTDTRQGFKPAPHRAPGRPRNPETEQAILRAAVEILDEAGYGCFSIEAVAARAGVGRPTVYRRWPSKLELAVEAVTRLAPPLQVADTGDPLADLRHLLTALLPAMTGSAAGRAIIALASDPQAHTELAPRLNERYLRPRKAVTIGLLRRAAEAGQIRPCPDPDLVVELLIGPALYRWLVIGEPLSREAAAHIIDTVLDLLAPDP